MKTFGDGNSMRLPDGPGWSPDGGNFWVRGDLLYWCDGEIWNMCDGAFIRVGLDTVEESDWHKYEDFSAWSDEKRAEVIANKKEKIDGWEAEKAKEKARIKALCISAKSKLTEDEYRAVQKNDLGEMAIFPWEDLP